MLHRYLLAVALALAVLLSGCTSVATSAPAPSVAPPAAGTATITGRVVSNSDRAPIDKVLVRLAPLFTNPETGESAFALDLAQAPGAISDAQGFFAIPDVAPNRYVIVIGDHFGVHDVIADSDGLARAYEAKAGSVLDAGILPVKPDVTRAP